jgi:hypothetical protein
MNNSGIKPVTMLDELPPGLKANVERMRNNTIIALVKRAGGRLVIPVAEIDVATGPLTMTVEGRDFVLTMEALN